ncbi:hypothetical protein BDL97_08G102900 [Sphagnum fallax]|nr:hypothetical protein BDL97_08G102900 [Sphagnum fallax]
MRRAENLQQAAAPLNNYQFDFELGPGLSKPQSTGSLRDQKKQPTNTSSQAPGGWSASSSGLGPSQTQRSDQSFEFLSQSQPGASKPNLYGSGMPSQSKPTGLASTHEFLGRPNAGGVTSTGTGDGFYSNSKSVAGNLYGTGGVFGQPQSKGVDLTGRSWGQIPTSKSVTGIPGIATSSKEDVFGDLLGGALGRSSGPLKQQNSAPSGLHGVGNLKSSLPESRAETAKKTPAPPAVSSGRSSFSYTAMFNNPPPAKQASPEPFSMGAKSQSKVDPFAGLSFSKPSSGPIGASGPKTDPFAPSVDPFVFASNSQTKAQPQSSRAPSSRPAASGIDQFSTLFGSGKSSVSRAREDPLEAMLSSSQAPSIAKASDPVHDGWGEVFGAAAHSNSFENEGVTTELEGLGPPPAGVTGSAAYQKGNTFYKEGQFPNAIKWLSWAMELLQKEGVNNATLSEVITCRVSCYKEIGEYKKALADCTMACEMDEGSVEKLMQRAHLYESMEKYKLSVSDLKKVLKIEPGHRMATLTLNRLIKMLD